MVHTESRLSWIRPVLVNVADVVKMVKAKPYVVRQVGGLTKRMANTTVTARFKTVLVPIRSNIALIKKGHCTGQK